VIDVFGADHGISPVEQLIDDWYDLARKCGITVTDEDGELRPGIDQAITRTVTASVWFGIASGYLTSPAATASPAGSRSTCEPPERPLGGLQWGLGTGNVAAALSALAPELDRTERIVSLSERTGVLMISFPV
jgi:hypothetical protein